MAYLAPYSLLGAPSQFAMELLTQRLRAGEGVVDELLRPPARDKSTPSVAR